MKFPKISALVPKGEHFDESAVNEGVWISQNHLSSIENGLTVSETAAAAATTSLETANASVKSLTEELAAEKLNSQNLTAANAASAEKITQMETAATTAKATSDARIKELEEEVAALGKTPSGTGSTVVTTEDEKVEENKNSKPGLLDPNHPVNQYAATQLAAKSKTK